MTMRVLMLGVATMLVSSCEQKKSGIVIGQAKSDCDLKIDGLKDTEWLFLKANPDGTTKPDVGTRLKLYEEGGTMKAKYNAGSLADMYTFPCSMNPKKEGEMLCFEEPKVKDWCQAYLVMDKECTLEQMQKIDHRVTQEMYDKGLAEAKANVDKYRGTDSWDSFLLNNNNLGNKLQGRVYITVDDKKCRLTIADMYMVIYNGTVKEDSNPAGINAFVKNEQGELLWEHCTDSGDLVAIKQKEFPKTPDEAATCAPNHQCYFGLGEDVHYHYVGSDARQPKDGCSYSFDLWAAAKPVVKDQATTTDGKELRWQYSTKYEDEAGPKVAVMTRYETCGGEKKQVEVACNVIVVQ